MVHRRRSLVALRNWAWFGLSCVGLTLLTTTGCNKSTSKQIEPPATARQLLDRMVDAYQSAKSYADSGQLKLSYRKQGAEPVSQSADDSVTFVRPNKVRIHCYQAIVVSDGKQLRATIADLPGQVLDTPAPAELKRDDLFADEILTGVLTQGLAGESIQLALLLLPEPLQPILEGAEEPTLLSSHEIDGDECHRVQVTRTDGNVIFWIDHQHVLRRIEFPTEELKKQITQHEQAPITDVALVADFKGARLNDRIADVAFEFALPDNAKLVKHFQVQPEPLNKLLGRKIESFGFVDLEGKPVNRDSLSGKVVVIDFWATWCGWCFKGLPNLQQVYDKYRDNDRVAIITVSTDEVDVSNEDLTKAFAKVNLNMPILRDVDQQARSLFDVQGLPTMIVLGPDGTVQTIDVGYQPQLAVELPRKIDRLLSGENLYQLAQREQEARQQSFESSLANGNQETGDAVEIPRAKIAARSEPKKLALQPLWHSDEATRPGNILAIEQPDGSSQFLVADGWRTVVALDGQGNLASRYELEIPDEAAISYLRTATDVQGNRYFAGTASAQQQVFVFDGQFKKLLSYPEGEHAGISDVRLADMDGDGQPDLNVGYWGVVGVQSVTLDGRQRWSDRTLENVFCLTVTPPADGHRGLLAADGRGVLVPIDDEGKDGNPISLPGRFLRWVVAADLNHDGQVEFCAIASTKVGVESAVGLSATGDVLWTYDLPVGAQANAALEMVAAGQLTGDTGQWVLAGADGSIHILSADGKMLEQFHMGNAVSGLAVATVDGRGTLVVATDKGVDAWQVAK